MSDFATARSDTRHAKPAAGSAPSSGPARLPLPHAIDAIALDADMLAMRA
jgi:hypothetical protein